MRKIVFLILFCALIIALRDACAHPPSDIKIEYNKKGSILGVIVTHHVTSEEKHFINKIDVWLNGEKVIEHKISSQYNVGYQSVAYMMPDVKVGDIISVEAYCNMSGKLKKDIKVE